MLIWQQSYHLLVAVCRKATLCWCLSGRYHKSTLWWSHNVASQTTPGWGCWSLKTGTCNCVYCHHQRDKEYYTVDENHTTLRRMRWPLKSCARKSPNGLSDLCKLPHFHLPYFMARVVVNSDLWQTFMVWVSLYWDRISFWISDTIQNYLPPSLALFSRHAMGLYIRMNKPSSQSCHRLHANHFFFTILACGEVQKGSPVCHGLMGERK